MDFSTAYDGISNENLGTVYLLYGQEHLFIDKYMARLAQAAKASLIRFDYENGDTQEALLELQSVSLFSDQPLVVLRNCTAITTQGKTSEHAELLESYIKTPVPGRTLIVTVAADKVDERKKLTKAMKKHVVVECHTPNEAVAMRMLKSEVNERALNMVDDAISELWFRTGSVSQATNEIDKLAVYSDSQTIGVEDVRELVAKTLEESIFDWVDHVVSGRIYQATQLLTDLQRQGQEPLALLGMLARQFRMMWFTKALQRKGMRQADIAKIAKVHPYALRIAEKQSHAFSLNHLEQFILAASKCDYDIKRGRQDGGHAILYIMLLTAQSTTEQVRAR